MDWYPLWNSLRIALISCAAVFFLGIFAAYYIAKLPRVLKGVLDVVLTLPMVLPPTVVGYFLLLLFGAKRPLGIFFMEHFGVKLVMNWYSAIFASIVVAFPLMYRTARGAFESFDETLAWSAQTLGLSNTWIFWRVRMPCCRQGILAGTVLAFARALGEYGATSMIAGYTPGKTATIATTVYQLWRTNDEAGAMQWVLVDIVISAVVLLAVNLLERSTVSIRWGDGMDWYPLWNSLRIALISCAAVFFLGIFAAYYIAKLPRVLKGVLDVVLTLPMVLPPTVVGYFLLLLFGAKRPLGIFFMEHFGVKLVMNWYSAIFASIVVAFPLMYRTARGAFESFDETLAWSAQTLGLSNTWIFWRVRMPCCRQGILAGTVLAFARALGEYGATSMIAGYTPGKTATIATTVYQLWRTNDEAGAMQWVLVDIVISAVVLLAVNLLERRQKQGGKRA